jgi:predicted dehydrogenase
MKVLMVGLGGIGQRHVRNLRTLLGEKVEIFAVRTRGLRHALTDRLTIAPGVDFEAQYGILALPDLEAGLDKAPDAVFVTNPSSLHVGVALAAVEAGCHVFVEKPLSDSTDGVERLVEAAERGKRVGCVGYQLRFHPTLRRVKALLDAGAIGRILVARFEVGEYLPGWHPYEDYRAMYASRRDLGGGAILSQIHEIDLAYWYFGMPRRVFALGGHWSSLEIDVEDTASILLECAVDGRPLPVHVHQDYVQRPPSRRAEILGDEGKIIVDLHVPEVRVVDAKTGRVDVEGLRDFQRNELFLAELRHFLACVEGREAPTVSLREGARSLAVALAARRSIDSGAVVETA